MKNLLILLLCNIPLYAGAFQPAALERAVLSAPHNTTPLSIYSADRTENARRAVRLGYNYFHTCVNTPALKPSDVKIAIFISTKLQPFFDRINRSAGNKLSTEAQEEFVGLLKELSGLFQKNQSRYINSLLIDETAALQETWVIVQEAIAKGHF